MATASAQGFDVSAVKILPLWRIISAWAKRPVEKRTRMKNNGNLYMKIRLNTFIEVRGFNVPKYNYAQTSGEF